MSPVTPGHVSLALGLVGAGFGFLGTFMTAFPKSRRRRALEMGAFTALLGFVLGFFWPLGKP